MKSNPLKIWVFLIAASVVVGQALYARTIRLSEYDVKAAYLYHFAKFVEWPEEALPDSATFLTIGILGTDPFGEAFVSIQGKSVKGRQLAVKRFASLRDLEPCHILFISDSEKKRLPEILEQLDEAGVLIVGDMKGFARAGGTINFVLRKNKVQFEINVDAAERAGLKLSSKLLKLAFIVRDERRESAK